jgi:hypothetical protein
MYFRFRNIKNRGAIGYDIICNPYKILAPYYVTEALHMKRKIVSYYIRWASATFNKDIAKFINLRPGITLEPLDKVDGRIILRWIFSTWDKGHEMDLSGSGKGQVAGCCNRGNEPSGSIKSGKFFD